MSKWQISKWKSWNSNQIILTSNPGQVTGTNAEEREGAMPVRKVSRLAWLRQRTYTEYWGPVVLSSVGYWEIRSPGLLPNDLSGSIWDSTSLPLQEHPGHLSDRSPAELLHFPQHMSCAETLASSSRHPRCLPRTLEAPRHTYNKTNQGATPHTHFWFCSQPHPPPLPPPTLRKPDVQMVNREKKIPPRPLETRLVWLGFESAQRLLHVCYL